MVSLVITKWDSLLLSKDMDLIEVLWKQDVDMGFSLEQFQEAASGLTVEPEIEEKPKLPIKLPPDLQPVPDKKVDDFLEEDPWAGLSYTIDLETGEYILKEEKDCESGGEDEPPSALLGQADFSLEEALQLVGLNEDSFELPENSGAAAGRASGEVEVARENQEKAAASPQEEANLEEDLDLLSEMIQTPNYHHHPRHFQGRMPYMRSVSMEQRWQDLASLLSLGPGTAPATEYPHYLHHHPQPPYHHPPPTLPPDPYPPIGPGNNVGSAVASSMNLMTNSSEPMGGEHGATAFKMENPHDAMYYQNGTAEMNHNNADGFLSSILNDEDLQLMDMAMNEGMYTMRMLEGAGGSGGGTDSDSAVSSMGSERVPSLTSDTEWMETNSDSGHTPADHFMTDYPNKYRWYEYGYTRQHSGESSGGSSGYRMPPVAQKKHHMYGKRMFQEQNAGNNSPVVPLNNTPCQGNAPGSIKYDVNYGPTVTSVGGVSPTSTFQPPPVDTVKGHNLEMKYSCSVEFTRQNLGASVKSSPAEAAIHNHTYHMPPEHSGIHQRPLTRDKKVRKSEEEHHLSRDERRARALNIPISVDDIINLPMDEFNERLSKYDLSETQLSLIRDIRRRGKNKVAAQNCRKRKLDQILSLADEVKQMREKKQRLLQERELLLAQRYRVKTKFSQLYRHIFQSLRDSDGNPYSPSEWSLQQTADGSVVLVPRGNQSMLDPPPPPSKPPSS